MDLNGESAADFDDAVGCTRELFKESNEVIEMIDNIKTIYEDDRSVEIALERLTFILDQYQEQPHLLDSHLNVMINKTCSLVRDNTNSNKLKRLAFKYMWRIIKVRGYKVVTRHFPHEVSDLEAVLGMLEHCQEEFHSDFESSYVLLLWLSIIVKIPFEMARFDGLASGDNTVTNRIVQQCQKYLHATSTLSTVSAAAYLTSAFLTRIDIVQHHLENFLNWIYQFFQCKSDISTKEEIEFTGSLVALAAILKYGKREDLLPYASEMLNRIMKTGFNNLKTTRLKKFGVKVIQRIGMTFLRPKVASWRYQRGSRSLAENLKMEKKVVNSVERGDADIAPEEDFHVPDEVEDVIDELIKALKDSETIIRWSAAKGIGRVTSRLPRELADDVVSSVLELLTPQENDASWHGGCLTLAELGRRGLLLPQHLPKVIPILKQALVYEDSRGYYSIGDHVRDGACYVAWSFARAYDPEVLQPFVQTLASSLLVVALFDREVKCRKAAAAAFQENVGRQGTFPHGIDIVTAADYFSVAVRQNAYLKISVYVGGFSEYTRHLIEHLISLKVDQWDAAIRELTASALHNLTALAPDLMLDYALPELILKIRSSDVNCRHGALLALAEIIYGLSKLNRSVDKNVIDAVTSILDFYREHEYLSGVGGMLIRQGCCFLIRKSAESHLSLNDHPVLEKWLTLINECLTNEVAAIREQAAAALNPFLCEYYLDAQKSKKNELIDFYLNGLNSSHQTDRIGMVAALGNLPKFMLLSRLAEIISGLLNALVITELTLKWAEYRRDTIRAIVNIVETVGVNALITESHIEWDPTVATNVGAKTRILPGRGSGPSVVEAIFEALLICMNEYTNDSRGDVGAWVREAAMLALKQLTLLVCTHGDLMKDETLGRFMGLVAQQAVERINRTRVLAGRVFSSLLHSRSPVLTGIPHRQDLLIIFPEELCLNEINWGCESQTFPKFVQLLNFPCYSLHVMQGFIMSIGGMTESLVKHSSESYFSYLRELSTEERQKICNCILKIYSSNLYDARVLTPMYVFLDRLLGSGTISDVLSNEEFPMEILKLLMEVNRAKDFRQLLAKMDVLCQLVQVTGNVSRSALAQMCVFLCHRLKAVRKAAAGKLYECLLVYGDVSWVPDDKLDDAMTLIADVDWEADVAIVKPQRQLLCELINVPIPKVIHLNHKDPT